MPPVQDPVFQSCLLSPGQQGGGQVAAPRKSASQPSFQGLAGHIGSSFPALKALKEPLALGQREFLGRERALGSAFCVTLAHELV